MKKEVLETLVEESLDLEANHDNAILNPNAHTISLYKAVTNNIIKDIVNIQTTDRHETNVYCWEQIDANGDLIVNTPATYTGMFGLEEREALEKINNKFPDKEDFKEDSFFIFEDVVFQSIKDNPFDGIDGAEPEEKIANAIFEGTIRYASDASNKEGVSPTTSTFRMKSWRSRVGNRHTRLDITTEALQNLGSFIGIDPEKAVIDSLANIIAEDINKDIIHKLISVSKRYRPESTEGKPFVDFVNDDRDKYIIGREIYSMITEMSAHITSTTKFTPDYVLASPRVAALVNSSGMSEAVDKGNNRIKDKYILNNGLLMVVDVTAKFDYMVVGVKNQHASSLYMSVLSRSIKLNTNVPHSDIENDNVLVDIETHNESSKIGSYVIKKAVGIDTLSPTYLCISRYALSAPPYSGVLYEENEKGEMVEKDIVYGDEWGNNANTSPLSLFMGIKLPKANVED